jgi:WhiB family transcriptional regulator, redox-sensing transcriptional regulator
MYFDVDQQPACTQTDPEIFFPDLMRGHHFNRESGQRMIRNTVLALTLCKSCPIQAKCLQFAVDNKEMHGIYGGTFGYERLKIEKNKTDLAIPFFTKLRAVMKEKGLTCPPIPKPTAGYVAPSMLFWLPPSRAASSPATHLKESA